MSLRIPHRYGVALLAIGGFARGSNAVHPLTKPQVANLITRVENGVDEFRDYLNRRGESASNANSTPQSQSRRARRGAPSESPQVAVDAQKDDLKNALDELNRSTNRLRRTFDTADKWMDTKIQVERVLEDARKINQVVARGKYGADAARLWAALRTSINDLARAYGLQPLAV